ncbi:MAG TPA: DUF2279 domain-containing protein [Candidatus Methylomirabilis sp.]|nr:DUF2279 domain-containing protein [Candidatus Methylomirabilis sp.]
MTDATAATRLVCTILRRAGVVIVSLGLFLVPAERAVAEGPSSPVSLVPVSDLTLSGPEEGPSSEHPSSGLELAPADHQLADHDAPPAQTADDIEPKSSVERWSYRALPYLIPIGVAAGGLENSLTDSRLQSFRFTNEGYFGSKTYAGGADKASHFVDYTIVSREIAYLYHTLGYSENASILLGLGVGFLGGLANEIGDGFNQYGFSFQDLAMDSAGAVTSALVLAMRTQDLVGSRYGFLLPKSKATCCMVVGPGRDYSYEIYTVDLKLAGAGRRLGANIGPLRYLLFSVTYGTKFYPTGEPDLRERQVGFEIGLNFEEILTSLGVRRDTWWGYGLHVVFDNTRFPFTSVGFQYDLNHHRWYGPGNGNQYSTTP